MTQTPDIPSYVQSLLDNPLKAVQYLLPEGEEYDGVYYAEAIQVDLKKHVWLDYATGKGGNVHDLWMYVRQASSDAVRQEIKDWLYNIDSPPNMKRFSFGPEQLSDPLSICGQSVEIMPQVHFYPGTTTLLAGYNGSGKSTMATQIAHMMVGHGIDSFILSPEMPPEVTGWILHRQATSVANPTTQEWTRVQQHCRNHFLLSTTEDRITPQVAIKQFDDAYAAGARLIILDSLTCIRTGHELYQQADFADLLRGWTRAHPDCYMLVIAHMRKPSGYQGSMISRYDIRGAGEISDLAGHIWLMQRKNPFSSKEVADYGDYDARLIVDKNRATGKLVCKMLRFSNVQKLFHNTKQPPCYIEYMYSSDAVQRIY